MTGLEKFADAIFNNKPEFFQKLKRECECLGHNAICRDGWLYCEHCGKNMGQCMDHAYHGDEVREYRATETEALKNNT